MADQQEPTSQDAHDARMARIERINHWIRVGIAIVIPTVFVVGMIAYYFTYR